MLSLLGSLVSLSLLTAASEVMPPLDPAKKVVEASEASDLMKITQDARSLQLIAHARINGVPMRLMIDTGATHTVLHQGSVEKLPSVKWIDMGPNIQTNAKQSMRMMMASLHVGPGESDEHPIVVMDLSGIRSAMIEPNTLDGILGMDMLNHLPFTFNFAKKEFYWGMPNLGDLRVVPLTGERDASGRLMMPVTCSDKTFSLLLDTGSSITRVLPSDWAPGKGATIQGQLIDVNTAGHITTQGGAPSDLTLAEGLTAKALMPLLCNEGELPMLGLDALKPFTLIHFPMPNAFGIFFLAQERSLQTP
jgi:hypothetical protein